MPSTIDKIVKVFPFPSIPPIVGAPDLKKSPRCTYSSTQTLRWFTPTSANGDLGLLYLTVSPAVYNTLSATTFILLSNPGATSGIPVGSTAVQISALQYAHTTTAVLFDMYNHTDKSLLQQLLSAVDKLFVRSLRHQYFGYGTVLTCNILEHLYATYANISTSELQ